MLPTLQKILTSFNPSESKRENLSISVFPHMSCSGIAAALQGKSPFLVSRLGWFETYAIGYWDEKNRLDDSLVEKMWNTPGIFPATEPEFHKFHKEYTTSMKKIDLLGLMRCPYEKQVVSRYAAQALRCELLDLEPYYNPVPWSRYLEGLRVLVINPFVESIRRQYESVREKLFVDKTVLPQFELITLKPPQTLCGNTDGYDSWSEALSHLKERVSKVEFDAAIVGCGAYGLPVSAFVKEMGKPCFHIGGATQILFGVAGGRWVADSNAMRLYINRHWVRPSEDERPKNWETAEKGCYW